MVKVFCDMCGKEVNREVDGVNLDFNHYGVVRFNSEYTLKDQQLCVTCACSVIDYIKAERERRAGDGK